MKVPMQETQGEREINNRKEVYEKSFIRGKETKKIAWFRKKKHKERIKIGKKEEAPQLKITKQDIQVGRNNITISNTKFREKIH